VPAGLPHRTNVVAHPDNHASAGTRRARNAPRSTADNGVTPTV